MEVVVGSLLKLRQWLTVAEAASYLSRACVEELSEADILRLGFEGRLTLSVDFVNGAYANTGRIMEMTEATYFEASVPYGKPIKLLRGTRIDDDKFLEPDQEVVELRFAKHLNPDQIGDMNGEEEQCALAIELNRTVKRWVRNLERRADSFRLVTATDFFYPDFLAQLTDGRYLAVEYKGAHLADGEDTEEKRLIGQKWADASDGSCLFLMVTDRDYGAVDRALA